MTDRAARRRAELRLVEGAERPELAPGECWPEPDRRPWRGPTERGRALVRTARERLAAAQAWTPTPEGCDDARRDATGDYDMTGHDTSRGDST